MKREEAKLYYVQGLPVPETPKPSQDPKPWKETEVIVNPCPVWTPMRGSVVLPFTFRHFSA